jgi:hypothetical protein
MVRSNAKDDLLTWVSKIMSYMSLMSKESYMCSNLIGHNPLLKP